MNYKENELNDKSGIEKMKKGSRIRSKGEKTLESS
jgi:hypothetical protein